MVFFPHNVGHRYLKPRCDAGSLPGVRADRMWCWGRPRSLSHLPSVVTLSLGEQTHQRAASAGQWRANIQSLGCCHRPGSFRGSGTSKRPFKHVILSRCDHIFWTIWTQIVIWIIMSASHGLSWRFITFITGFISHKSGFYQRYSFHFNWFIPCATTAKDLAKHAFILEYFHSKIALKESER